MGKAFAWKGNPLNLTGTDDPEEFHGGNGPNTFRGLGGDDYLSGGNGNDTLDGGDGNDTIVGGDGSDTMSGGAGADVFRYTDHWQSQDIPSDRDGQFDRDTITDFDASDKIDLSLISSGAVTSFDQITLEAIAGGNIVHVDLGGLETNDMGIIVLGETPTEANFVFA